MMYKIGKVTIEFTSRNGYDEDISCKAVFHNAIISCPLQPYANRMKIIDTFKPNIEIQGWESAKLFTTHPDGTVKQEESSISKGKWYEEGE